MFEWIVIMPVRPHLLLFENINVGNVNLRKHSSFLCLA